MVMIFRLSTLKLLKNSKNVSDPMPEKKFCWPMIIKCLSEMYFLFHGPAWKYFVVYIISHKCTANIFVWWSGLKIFHGDYWLQQYILVVQASYTWVKIFFVSWLGVKTFCSYYYQANQFDGLAYKHDFE